MSTNEFALMQVPEWLDVRQAPGSVVLTLRGELSIVLRHDERQPTTAFFPLEGDAAFHLQEVRFRQRVMNIGVDRIEVVAMGLKPVAVTEETALGTLYLGDEGMAVVVKDDENRPSMLFNLESFNVMGYPVDARLGATRWKLRGMRKDKIVFEHEVDVSNSPEE